MAEDTGEPVGRINDHGLANRSITTLAIFLNCPVTGSGAAQFLRSVSVQNPQQALHFFLDAGERIERPRKMAYETISPTSRLPA